MAHILIAEDDLDISRILFRLLTRFGHMVEVAHDGATALECLTAGPYDLLITDLNLPRLSGTNFLRPIRAGWPALPVIVCSGQEASPEVLALTNRFLGKPFQFPELLAILDALLACSS